MSPRYTDPLIKQLETVLPAARVKSRLIDLVAYASDAGFYYLRPRAVVQPVSEEEIGALFRFSHQHMIPLTFRTAGTSLSGQSITDGILVDLSKHWNGLKIEEEGAGVRLQPGITGAMVNAGLRKFSRKIGPDPSSINSAMIGGILSNNSSGMCCGVRLNSYHTCRYIRFMLPDGKVFSTENKGDYERFMQECPRLSGVIGELAGEIAGNAALHDRIRRKYLTKNTVGYSLNAFIDYSHPLDILAHLLIGAEGTLGFIAEAVLETIPDEPCKSTALLYFPDIYAACQAIVPLSDAGAGAVELMDRASLRSVENIRGVPERLKTLPETAAALLVEFQGSRADAVEGKKRAFLREVPGLSLLDTPRFTGDLKEQAFLWKLRKGLFPAVGAVRARGTTVILEDIAFPVEKLGDAILDLQKLFKKYRYTHAIIFGHAKDGNIHFCITQGFGDPAEVDRYSRFMEEVVALVVKKYDGALKAEHGTGRNMAPFVETEWGGEAYRIMKILKHAVDPENLLNPGVIINTDKKAHIRDLKAMPAVEEEVDKCIECGYCEHKCPSRDITLTPRQRIVVRRELAQLKAAGDKRAVKQLLKDYRYDGLETCAVDGLCATACPVDINTGDLVKRLRKENHSVLANRLAVWLSRHFGIMPPLVRAALRTGTGINKLLGPAAMRNLTGGIRKMIPVFPLWSNQLQAAPRLPRPADGTGAGATLTAVYFPSCISRMMGGAATGKKSLPEVFQRVSEKAGIELLIPAGVRDTCCGQLFSSKGFTRAHTHMANEIVSKLWEWTLQGKRPVVLDVTSCTHTLQSCRSVLSPDNQARFDRLKILDSIDYLHDYILPNVRIERKKEQIVLHPVCSIQKMGLEEKLTGIARHFSREADLPLQAGCCGMAGDRGFLHPGLVRSATAGEAGEVRGKHYDGYYSTAKTCEMALSDAVGKNYESILYLVNECI